MEKKGREITTLSGKFKGTISSFLQKKYGGRWKYDGRSAWYCDDNTRVVKKVRTGLYCGKENKWFGSRYYMYLLRKEVQ